MSSTTLSSFGELAAILAKGTIGALAGVEKGLERAAVIIERDAKARIGHYQGASGPFAAWDPLAPATEEEKARLGFPTDAPLERTGQLRDSIQHEVHGTEAVIGSQSKVAGYQEFGTNKIPPRPFMGPAAFDNAAKVQKVIGDAAISGLVGGDRIHPSLGYDSI